MTDLQYQLEEIVRSIDSIPDSRGFWLNRTNQGEYYDSFKDNGIIALNIDDISLAQIADIRKRVSDPRGRPIYHMAQTAIQELIYIKNKKKLIETPKERRNTVKSQLTLTANQIFHFSFLVKKGDFVVIPSTNSKDISIGRVAEGQLDNPTHFPLQRKVEWIETYKRETLDPNFFRAFFSRQALTNMNKYRDVVLRTLYDFYFDGENAHLVLNLGAPGKISFKDESSFLYNFIQLLDDYFEVNDLPYSVNDLSTIVNLNSKGKRKLFGPRTTIFMAGMLLLAAVGGGFNQKGSTVSLKTEGILKSMSDFLNEKKRREIADHLLKKSDSLSLERQNTLIKLIQELDTKE